MSGLRKEPLVEKKIQMENILEERNSKLSQLFWLSRLNEMKGSADMESLKSELNDFLMRNDLRKNVPFEVSNLPVYKPQEPQLDKRPVRSKSITPSENGSHKKKDENLSAIDPENRKRTRDSQMTEESSVAEKSLEPPLKQQKKILDGFLVPQTVQATNGKEIGITGNMPHGDVLRTSSEPAGNVPSVNAQQVSPTYNLDILNLHVKPTEVETKKKQNPIIEEIRKGKHQQSQDLFKESEVNKDSVYLVMDENIPTKLPQAVPLAELKYVSQTLPLIRLIPSTHKVLTTDLYNTALNEGRITVVSSRIEELRRLNLWSLRQPKKFIDPWASLKAGTHHNIMLSEAKWMREDFNESKKFKIAMCALIAEAVKDYWKYGKVCLVKRKMHSSAASEETDKPVTSKDIAGNNEDNTDAGKHGLPCDDNDPQSIDTTLLFEKPDPNKEVMLPDLPQITEEEYKQNVKPPIFKIFLTSSDISPLEKMVLQNATPYSGLEGEKDKQEEVPFVPISKSTVILDNDKFLKLVEKQIIDEEPSLVALSKRRGMFYGNRRSHYLKPPVAPALRYLKFRTPTIWSPDDDQELVKNINQYAYNWELISSQMSSQNTRSYVSNIERRTPWQCFERFVQLNERFSIHDMKGPRAHAAQVWLHEAHKLQQQQKRRISPLGVGPESIQRGHRRLRWASMFEAMRKNIKKRENAPRPNPSQPRKPLDVKSMVVPTPAEISELKAQRDETLRREGQLRRAAKQRIELAQIQQQQQEQPQQLSEQTNIRSRISSSAPGTKELNNDNKAVMTPRQTQSSPITDDRSQLTIQTPRQSKSKSESEQDVIERYANKIMAQRPELTQDIALKAAENYYKNVNLKHQQQQTFAKQAVSQSNTSLSTNAGSASNGVANKIRSPTPQEILQRIQQKQNDS
ncbi:HBR277Cp [Eremothecium sinecaudum]|uniref:Chromatin modification-related protein EAF1 n=1 Tax=Eremothecium sinecaudum TaxID=45286 RepID=A0A109UXB0_9SACH|nr:HBR277Cp [Eremothecium sinecaudum]AMD19178.1 HBR277Cp [Eremothecium sinecaudum]